MTNSMIFTPIKRVISKIKFVALHFGVAGLGIVVFLNQNDARSDDLSAKPTMTLSGSTLKIKTPSGKNQVIKLDRTTSASDITMENFTFGKYADLKILDTEGASQKFYKIYLYDISSGFYKYSRELSAIPCVQTDAKQKEILGACFHESACENWEERYTMSNTGKLALVKRSGTYCDATGQGYFYIDTYKNGKKISSTVKPVEDNPPDPK